MTRENKLVMVIGFGLLLFVGILVSDHLSARGSQIGTPETLVSLRPDKPLPGSNDAEVVEPFGRADRGQDGAVTIDGVKLVPTPPPTIIADPLPPAAPAERMHTIAKGDNPEKLAQKYYGKRSLAVALAKYNGIDPSKLKIGQALKIPDIAVLDPSSAPAAGDRVAGVAPPPVVPGNEIAPPAAKSYRMVTVKQGDNIYRIAARELGGGKYAKQIEELNPGLKPRALKPGQQLRIALAN